MSLPQRIVYISTSGVYGDCSGERVDETRVLCPGTARAHRRVDAERQLRAFGRRGVVVNILPVPGIYAADRLPIERLRRGVAALRTRVPRGPSARGGRPSGGTARSDVRIFRPDPRDCRCPAKAGSGGLPGKCMLEWAASGQAANSGYGVGHLQGIARCLPSPGAGG